MAASVRQELELTIKAVTEQAEEKLAGIDKTLTNLEEQISKVTGAYEENAQASQQVEAAAEKQTDATKKQSVQYESLSSTLEKTVLKYFSLKAVLGTVTALGREALESGAADMQGLARLQAVITTAGKSYALSARQVDDWASALERSKNVDKQGLMDAAAGLLTFENIDISSYERLFEISADLDAVWGNGIGPTLTSLGKVLEDPISGMDSLKRLGIVVSAETKNVVTSLINQNDKYEAQKVLLGEIQGKVSGVAQTIANTPVGQYENLIGAWKAWLGEAGKTLLLGFEGLGLSDFFWNKAKEFGDANRLDELGVLARSGNAKDSVSSWSTKDIEDAIALLKDAEDQYIYQFGPYSTYYPELLKTLQEILPIRLQEAAVAEEQAAADKTAQEQAAQRLATLEEQKDLTSQLQAIYDQTDQGRKEALENEIRLLEQQKEIDEFWAGAETDPELLKQFEARLKLYEAVIEAKQAELDGMTPIIEENTESYISKLFDGGDASSFILNIPVGFDFGRTGLQTLEEKLTSLKGQITKMWSAGPEDGDTGEWQSNLDILAGKYDEIEQKITAIKDAETLRSEASKLLATLVTEEEKKAANRISTEETLNKLVAEKLISEKQRDKLWEKAVKAGEMELTLAEAINAEFNKMGESLKKQFFSADALGSTISSTFSSIGESLASGESGMDGFSDSMGQFTQQILSQISQMSIAAGLRILAETGIAGLPIALGLFAIGGVSGIASGLMGGGQGIDDSIMDSMQDELDVRQKLAETINSSIDTEYELLRRQLDRNLIDVATFREGAGDLQTQRNEADARTALSSAAIAQVNALDAELSGMSGWDKFWSGRDEDINREVAQINALYSEIATASVERLRQIMQELESLGIKTGSIPAFASGGDFLTSGPQMIMVGDNPGGVERVTIRPVSSSSSSSAAGTGNVVQIFGDVYGIEDLRGKLELAGMKMEARHA